MLSSIIDENPILGVLGAGLFIILGILLVGLGILQIFIARGLWRAKKWARIVEIILMCLGMLSSIVSMIQGNIAGSVSSLVISGVIGGYLLFSKKVKETFA
ncbi:MAG: hypothetical protein NTU63_03990 [Candidatus Pacearchaeota archaeon]|nr:hypothetical protein [Candidatus Pacearchaeota archaeon]